MNKKKYNMNKYKIDQRNSGGSLRQKETKRRQTDRHRQSSGLSGASICIQFSKRKIMYIGRNAQNLKNMLHGPTYYNRTLSL